MKFFHIYGTQSKICFRTLQSLALARCSSFMRWRSPAKCIRPGTALRCMQGQQQDQHTVLARSSKSRLEFYDFGPITRASSLSVPSAGIHFSDARAGKIIPKYALAVLYSLFFVIGKIHIQAYRKSKEIEFRISFSLCSLPLISCAQVVSR